MNEIKTFKFLSEDQNYKEWSILDEKTLKELYNSTTVDSDSTADLKPDINEYFKTFDPIKEKIFNQDLFHVNENKEVVVEYSILKKMKNIPGILKLEGNQTYGRCKDKYYYRCIPDDKRFPEFLVAYKNTSKDFSKKQNNCYVLFTYKEWTGKHPIGVLTNNIGTVDRLDNFYEYQLYCKSLYASIQNFKKATIKALKKQTQQEFIIDITRNNNVEDRQDWNIFSIDPQRSKDFDDAFSIKNLEENKKLISIYISNVGLWMDKLNIWDSFSERIATIYLPDQKRPMLPTILSDCLCSLIEHEQRFAFTLDLYVCDNVITDIKFSNTLIKVSKNFRYEDKELQDYPDYNNLFETSKNIQKITKNFYKINDSHDLVGFLMILMNYYSAKEMIKTENGIYRSVKLTSEVRVPEDLPKSVVRFLKGWNSSGGKYALFPDIEKHEILELESYIHITSPIRRLVDLLNIIQLQHNIGLVKFNENSQKFYDKWTSKIDYINTTMRSIRRVQCDCSLLDACHKNPEFTSTVYKGYVFDRIMRTDGLFQVFVHLPAINMTTRYISVEKIDNYSCRDFKIYLFDDEHNLKKKIRLMMV